MTVTRPVTRWHGGKFLLAPRIIKLFPKHRIYVEPFGGAYSVGLRKPRAYCEVYNDLDDQAVTMFRVLQDPVTAQQLIDKIFLTPFSRKEFELAWEPTDDPIEKSRRLIIRGFMGFGSNAHSKMDRGAKTTGFRANSNRSGTTPAEDWRNYPGCLPAIVDRLRGTVIENRDALQVIDQHDTENTLFYLDPPYVASTRGRSNKYDVKFRMYRHELDDPGHVKLLEHIQKVEGMIVLSGYPSEIYDDHLAKWPRIDIDALADGARPRVECLWFNPQCWERVKREGLLEGVMKQKALAL